MTYQIFRWDNDFLDRRENCVQLAPVLGRSCWTVCADMFRVVVPSLPVYLFMFFPTVCQISLTLYMEIDECFLYRVYSSIYIPFFMSLCSKAVPRLFSARTSLVVWSLHFEQAHTSAICCGTAVSGLRKRSEQLVVVQYITGNRKHQELLHSYQVHAAQIQSFSFYANTLIACLLLALPAFSGPFFKGTA